MRPEARQSKNRARLCCAEVQESKNQWAMGGEVKSTGHLF
jgi:hypothetical protein